MKLLLAVKRNFLIITREIEILTVYRVKYLQTTQTLNEDSDSKACTPLLLPATSPSAVSGQVPDLSSDSFLGASVNTYGDNCYFPSRNIL